MYVYMYVYSIMYFTHVLYTHMSWRPYSTHNVSPIEDVHMYADVVLCGMSEARHGTVVGACPEPYRNECLGQGYRFRPMGSRANVPTKLLQGHFPKKYLINIHPPCSTAELQVPIF